jgi:radical SAM enzyme (TIGR01210 family)
MLETKLLRDLQRINKSVVHRRENFEKTSTSSHIWHQVVESQGQGLEKRLIVILNSRGCSYAVNNAGPCFNCGLVTASSQGEAVSCAETEQQIETILRTLDFTGHNITELDLFNAGSLLNDWQVSPEIRSMLFEKISSINSIEDILIDSRPEDIDEKKLLEIKDKIGHRRLWVGIGLETADDTIRNFCINKNFSLNDFEQAVDVLKSCGAHLFSYVMFKPAILTEWEAIDDVVNTIRYLSSLSSKKNISLKISLEPGVVQGDCLLTSMYANDLYTTPWLWSVVRVIFKTHEFSMGRLRVGIPEEVPKVLDRRRNYEEKGETCACSPSVENCIAEYNKTKELTAFDSLPKCECERRWEAFLEEEKNRGERTLGERAKEVVLKLSNQD